jgi:eukaryotic-like serine/threonine-protein kinase
MHGAVRRNRVYLLAVQGRLQEAREEGVRVRASLEAIPGEVARISLQLFHVMYSEVQYVEGDYAGMRDALLGLQSSKMEPRGKYLSRLALACGYAPSPQCPGDLVARADAALPGPDRPHPSTRIVAQLALARLSLKRADAADAHRRLDDVEATAADPRLRLSVRHRWMAEMRMLRGDAFDAQGDREAAVREWHAAEAAFAGRYTPQHPYRRQLRERLEARVAMPRPAARR